MASCIFSHASVRKLQVTQQFVSVLQVTRQFVSVLQVTQDSSIAWYYDDTM